MPRRLALLSRLAAVLGAVGLSLALLGIAAGLLPPLPLADADITRPALHLRPIRAAPLTAPAPVRV